MADDLNPRAKKYSDFQNVENMKNYVTPEQMPEGPYGSPRNKHEPVQNKSTPWREGQRYYSAFNYEFKKLHYNIPRQGMEPAHPPHSEGKGEPDQ